jgi:WD40 repeat protein/serine/threonine protein kinase
VSENPPIQGNRAFSRKKQLRSAVPGQIAGHKLLRPIAEGSYGDVWLARNELTGTLRAIKIIWKAAFSNPKPYEREFEAIKRFEPISRRHKGFVDILQAGTLNEGFYYIMELADDVRAGQIFDAESYEPATLGNVKEGELGIEQCIKIGVSLADCLSALHRQNLIHRDVKPSNIIFVDGTPKLADIGLIAEVSEANSFVGTNGFIPPEGPINPRSDIFSLGKLLYEISTGRDRLEFPTLPDDITERESLLLELNPILLKACQPNPNDRYPNVEALKEELEMLLQGKSVRRLRQLEKGLRLTKIALAVTLVAGFAAFFIFAQIKSARAKAEKERVKKITADLTAGSEKLKTGDYLSAVFHYSRAAVLDSTDQKTHSLRIVSTLYYAPKMIDHYAGTGEAIAVSGDRKTLAFNQKDRTLFKSLNTTFSEELSVGAQALGLSYDGSLAALGIGSVARFVNRGNRQAREIKCGDLVTHINFSTNGTAAVTTTNGVIWLWPQHQSVPFAGYAAYNAVLNDRGDLICVLGKTGRVSVLNLPSLEPLPIHPHHAAICYDAVFAREGNALLTSSYDRTAICWDLATGREIGMPMEHNAGVTSISESPNGRIVATGSLDRTVKLWDGWNYSPLKKNHNLYHSEPVVYVKFVSNNTLISHCSDGTTYLWEIPTNDIGSEQLKDYLKVPDKRRITLPGVKLLARKNRITGSIGSRSIDIQMNAPVETIAINPTHTLLAAGTQDETFEHQSVALFTSSGKDTGVRLRHSDGITFVVFSHAGDRIATCSEDFSARLWDLSGKPISAPLRHRDQVRWAAFNANDEWLATVSWDGMLNIWSAENGLPVTAPINTKHTLEWVSFKSDYELLVSSSIKSYRVRLPSQAIDPARILSEIPTSPELLELP